MLSNNNLPLKVEPEYIYFGSLKPRDCGNAVLKVTGGPGDIVVHSDRLILTPSHFGDENTEIKVSTLPGSAGELIWDDIILKSNSGEIGVLITARWEGLSQEDVISKPLPIGSSTKDKELLTMFKTNVSQSVRPWTGRRCSKCQRNFAYDENIHDWERCTCNGYKMVLNISSYIVKELRQGVKYIPSYLQEIWNVILGKEKW